MDCSVGGKTVQQSPFWKSQKKYQFYSKKPDGSPLPSWQLTSIKPPENFREITDDTKKYRIREGFSNKLGDDCETIPCHVWYPTSRIDSSKCASPHISYKSAIAYALHIFILIYSSLCFLNTQNKIVIKILMGGVMQQCTITADIKNTCFY